MLCNCIIKSMSVYDDGRDTINKFEHPNPISNFDFIITIHSFIQHNSFTLTLTAIFVRKQKKSRDW